MKSPNRLFRETDLGPGGDFGAAHTVVRKQALGKSNMMDDRPALPRHVEGPAL